MKGLAKAAKRQLIKWIISALYRLASADTNDENVGFLITKTNGQKPANKDIQGANQNLELNIPYDAGDASCMIELSQEFRALAWDGNSWSDYYSHAIAGDQEGGVIRIQLHHLPTIGTPTPEKLAGIIAMGHLTAPDPDLLDPPNGTRSASTPADEVTHRQPASVIAVGHSPAPDVKLEVEVE